MKLQIPTEVPNPSNNTPIDLSNIFDVLLFIVAPLLLVVFYFLLRKKGKENADSKKEDI
ncbi:MAG TPA: adenylosuccinate synthetase [Flavobacteriaceae bacterium]|nr:adenylosuccinate synthetase [Flavobacteriaceae bacterium]HAT66937.1 adenylosuccinate synthetase [Flavobacteriaceae bacterium]|tara:strand:+ start:482 stop:658 length:177 start_codon:yes stop_codon:yes gene_type:complete